MQLDVKGNFCQVPRKAAGTAAEWRGPVLLGTAYVGGASQDLHILFGEWIGTTWVPEYILV